MEIPLANANNRKRQILFVIAPEQTKREIKGKSIILIIINEQSSRTNEEQHKPIQIQISKRIQIGMKKR